MDSVKEYTEIVDTLQRIKSNQKDFYTNFYMNEEECRENIELRNLFIINKQNTSFILKKYRNYYYLYFLSNNMERLEEDLKSLNAENSDITLISDIIGFYPQLEKPIQIFLNSGFYKYESLRRMSRHTVEEQFCDETVTFAEKTNIELIIKYFEDNFDELSEQIPTVEQLANWINKKSILCVKVDSILVGFLIFEVNGLTSYLRYWFVSPEFRNMKIGSKLLKAFFFQSNNTKRQLFWVIEKNKNAIKRYQHYGFNFESLYDVVLINKKKNERENY